MTSLTEKEAKDRYCPCDVKGFCVGSRCMAWIWTHVDTREEERREHIRSIVQAGMHFGKRPDNINVKDKYPDINIKGKCGMVKYES